MSVPHLWRRLVALPIVLAVALSAVLAITVTDYAQAAQSRKERKVAHALDIARNQKGDPYRYGSNGPGAFDCSGLTQYAFRKSGIYLPRTSDAQSRYVRKLKNKDNVRAGDFVFFASGGDVYHLGLFTGRWQDGRRLILHASRPGTPVKVDPIWTSSWYAGTVRGH